MSLTRIAPPATYPVDLSQLREHLRLDGVEQDPLLLDYLRAACAWVEQHTRRALMAQQWRLSLECWPSSVALIELPRPPLLSVDEVSYIDGAGVRTLVPGERYTTSAAAPLAAIAPVWGSVWPSARPQADSIRIDYTAGYADPQDVPADICHAILMLVAHWHEHREASIVGTISGDTPMAVDALLSGHRLYAV